jgi:hypothetical protein
VGGGGERASIGEIGVVKRLVFLFNLQPKRACTPPAGILFRVLAKQVRILNRIESRFHPVGRSGVVLEKTTVDHLLWDNGFLFMLSG